jgi:hypothetical protein
MKKLIVGFLALTIAVWIAAGLQAYAQQNSGQQSGSQQNQMDQNHTGANSGQNMSGTVSSNGNTLMNDKDNKNYKVDNPDALQGHENQHVAVIVHLDPDTGVLHIIHLEAPQP